METISNEKAPVIYAGFWLRVVAYLIDDLIIGFVGFFVALPFIGGIIFSGISMDHLSDTDAGTFLGVAGILGSVLGLILSGIAVGWLYFALMESSKNQATLGKMALNLKVTDMEGGAISFGRASLRYFGKILSSMIMMIGYILAGLTEKKQALHDMIAGCLVIRK